MSKLSFYFIFLLFLNSFFVLSMEGPIVLNRYGSLAQYIEKDHAYGLNEHCRQQGIHYSRSNLHMELDDETTVPIPHYVAACGSIDVMRLILDSKTDQEKKEILTREDSCGRTPMHHALANEKVGMFCLLYKNGVDCDRKTISNISDPLCKKRINTFMRGSCLNCYRKLEGIGAMGNDYYHGRMTQWTEVNKQFKIYECIGACLDGLSKSEDYFKSSTLLMNPNITGKHADCIDTPLHVIAFMSGDDPEKYICIAEHFLQRKANLRAINEYGNTPLHIAVSYLDIENPDYRLIELFLQYGADPKIKNFDGKTPLDLAKEEVEKCIKKVTRADNDLQFQERIINKMEQDEQRHNSMERSMELSQQSGLAKLVRDDNVLGFNKYCKKQKVDPLQLDIKCDGYTQPVLHYAAAYGSVTIMRSLLEKKTEEEKKRILNTQDSSGHTVMHHALVNENVGMFCFLYKNGVHYDQQTISEISDSLCKRRIEVFIGDNRSNLVNKLKGLGAVGQDYYHKRMKQWTDANEEFKEFNWISQYLDGLSKSMDYFKKNLILFTPDITGKHTDCIDTPLHVIALMSRDDPEKYTCIAEYFLRLKANLHAINEYGNTPLHIAMAYLDIAKPDYRLIELFLQKGADPDIKNFDDKVPLDLVDGLCKEKVEKLIKEKAVKNLEKNDGDTLDETLNESFIKNEINAKNTKSTYGLLIIGDTETENTNQFPDRKQQYSVWGWGYFIEKINNHKTIIGVGVGMAVISYWLVSYYKYLPSNLRFL